MSLEHRRDGAVVLVALAHPPVNALSLAVRRAMFETFSALRGDTSVEAVVLHGSGSGFCAGGDRTEIGTPDSLTRPTLSRDVLDAVESCGKPVVAALHGFAVGGGLELALACDARVVVAGTVIGLPETRIGVFPLSGTQRLPRLVGVATAADLMLHGTMLTTEVEVAAPLFDHIVASVDELLPAALRVARSVAGSRPLRVRDRPFPDPDPRTELRRVLEAHPAGSCTDAQRAMLEALTAAVHSPDFQSGLDRAQELFDELGSSRQALRH